MFAIRVAPYLRLRGIADSGVGVECVADARLGATVDSAYHTIFQPREKSAVQWRRVAYRHVAQRPVSEHIHQCAGDAAYQTEANGGEVVQ
jgi:hypothetical protein